MTASRHLTLTSALILKAVAMGYRYGFDIIHATGLPSGTVYPALRRLEEGRLVSSRWESERRARRAQRPARRYYEIRRAGEQVLAEAVQRYRQIESLIAADAAAEPTGF